MIEIKRLTVQNFLSIGNQPVSFDLNQNQITLVNGVNGSGKSVILDAICYSLFGKPLRSINLPQLVNGQNKKSLLTEIEFRVGEHEYVVRRGMKPKVLEIWIDDHQINSLSNDRETQAQFEKTVLKMNYKSFTQIVILGSSSFIPFMQLTAAARRECVEDFLDIKVFAAMKMLAKDRFKREKESMSDVEKELEICDYKYSLQKRRVKELVDFANRQKKDLNKTIGNKEEKIGQIQAEIDSLEKERDQLFQETSQFSEKSIKNNLENLMNLKSKALYRLEESENRIEFYSNNEVCNTCNQTISEEWKLAALKKEESRKQRMNRAQTEIEQSISSYQDTLKWCQQNAERARNLTSQLSVKQFEKNSMLKDIQRIKDEFQSNSGSNIEQEIQTLRILSNEKKKLKSQHRELAISLDNYEVTLKLLRDDGIKSQIIRKYLPVMNQYIHHYLKELDFPVFFSLDEEFNEIVQSPLYQDFSYYSFSEGQKARINVALLLMWREVAKLKNSVNCNLLFFDETFSSSLDAEGREYLFKLLKYNLPNTNIFVVDHTLDEEFQEKFNRRINVKLVNGFSQYS